ncbi:MAG: nuclear transport factor 2 family protein [Solirubrobacterales bacterium]
MSQENVEKLRALLVAWDPEAWRQGQFDASLFDPRVTYEDKNLPDHVQETYRGHEGVIRATERWVEPFAEMTIELEEILGTGDHLVSVHRVSARARHTGIEFSGPVAYEWTFRHGKVIHFQSFRDRAEALEAAGLSE